ncbi:uncharacterized protein LOC117176335 [Belonocnema kinseyi]|uniref:uncharacterized protein LOC117176335 n=1 Tax=Belonocnema kinseyi TaxID=2817044 RepID=UPI00143DD3BA|nr:uncharacterized protein LOC117176335 [Belonocnema kinseyi]
MFRGPLEKASRACIAVKGLVAILVLKLCSRERLEVVIASTYFPGDADGSPPPREVEILIQHCQENSIPLLLGCDANSHHTVWGSINVNGRERDLIEYLAGTDMEILIRAKPVVSKIRNPRNTLWDSYKEELRGKLVEFPKNYGSIDELEHAVDFLRRALTTSYENNCPTSTVKSRKGAEWWNTHPEKLRKKTRALCNRENRTKLASNWDIYEDRRRFCEEFKDIPETARLYKILAKTAEARLRLIRLENGGFGEDEEATLSCLLEVRSLDFRRIQTDLEGEEWGQELRRADWSFASKIVDSKKVELAVGSFCPCKSPGADGIYPLFSSSIALKHVSSAWKDGRVAFIPNPGSEGYTAAKNFRPISLASFIRKTLKRLVERYIRKEVLLASLQHRGQHAFQTSCSVETTLHAVVAKLEQKLGQKWYVVETFLDIEGAFINTPPEVVCERL